MGIGQPEVVQERHGGLDLLHIATAMAAKSDVHAQLGSGPPSEISIDVIARHLRYFAAFKQDNPLSNGPSSVLGAAAKPWRYG